MGQPRPIDLNPFRPYAKALKEMAQSHLLLVALAWSFFYLLGMMALLVLPDFSELLQITPEMNNNLLGVLGITIGIGSVIAGLISGKHIEPRLIPVGAIGMTIFFILLGLVPPSFWTVALLLGAAGLFGGFYIVPLQSIFCNIYHLLMKEDDFSELPMPSLLSSVALAPYSSAFSAMIWRCLPTKSFLSSALSQFWVQAFFYGESERYSLTRRLVKAQHVKNGKGSW